MTNDKLTAAVDYIRSRGPFRADIALVLGSGLGNFVDHLERTIRIPFWDIPGFPLSTVEGHSGELVYGYLEDVPVLVNSGRVHFYEGYTLEQVVYPVEVLHALGARTLILTNAAGSINRNFEPGTLMLIDRLLNLTGSSVFAEGPEPEHPFATDLLKLAVAAAGEAHVPVISGAYAGLTGPNYETPAEIRFLRMKQADAVGMSTVHESMRAVQLGLQIIGVSCLTNYAAGILDQPLNHQEVIETGQRVRKRFAALLESLVRKLARQ